MSITFLLFIGTPWSFLILPLIVSGPCHVFSCPCAFSETVTLKYTRERIMNYSLYPKQLSHCLAQSNCQEMSVDVGMNNSHTTHCILVLGLLISSLFSLHAGFLRSVILSSFCIPSLRPGTKYEADECLLNG